MIHAKKTKKHLCIILVLTLLLCGCHSGEETQPVTSATQQTETEILESLETTPPTENNALSDDELAQFQALFADPMGWYARALTSLYETPTEVDLEKMFYCGAGETPVSEQEREYLQSTWSPGMFDFDIVRCDEAVMEEILQSVFGVGLQDMSGTGLENMTYFEGAYFRVSSDVLITIVQLQRGIWMDEAEVELYYESDIPGAGMCCVTMRLLDDRWVIVSNCLV